MILRGTIIFLVKESNLFYGQNKSHAIESKSVFLEYPLVHPNQAFFVDFIVIPEDLSFYLYSSFFCGQDLTSRHITDSVNFKNTMQQGGKETIRIPGNRINTALDLPVQWLS